MRTQDVLEFWGKVRPESAAGVAWHPVAYQSSRGRIGRGSVADDAADRDGAGDDRSRAEGRASIRCVRVIALNSVCKGYSLPLP